MSISVNRFPRRKAVDYQSIRDEIRSGDILMCAGNAWFSKLIQRATGSTWSHVAFVMRLDEIGRVMVMESVESSGVRTVPLRSYLNDYNGSGEGYNGGLALVRHRQFAERVSAHKLKSFGQFAADLFGYPYDRNEIAKIATRIAASRLPFSGREHRELQRDKEYICSEYVWECYKSVGIRVPHHSRGFITPADFARTPEVELLHVLRGR